MVDDGVHPAEQRLMVELSNDEAVVSGDRRPGDC
jgi:hypothetical protein